MDEKELVRQKVIETFTNVFNIIEAEIVTLPYFNCENYLTNKESLEISLLQKPFSYEGVDIAMALYYVESNTLYICPYIKDFALLALHESIHMMSCNRKSKVVGYCNNKKHQLLNEAATEYLVKKTMGKSVDYPEVVTIFEQYVQKYGEEKMYYGFFEANFSKFYNNFTSAEQKDIYFMIEEMNKYQDMYTLKYNMRRKETNI